MKNRNSVGWNYGSSTSTCLGLSLALSLCLISCFEEEDNAIPLTSPAPVTSSQVEDSSELRTTEEREGEDTLTVDGVKLELLSSFSSRVVGVTYAEFSNATKQLLDATKGWATSLTPEDRKTAQEAWLTATSIWQRAEVFQVGPAAASGEFNEFGQNYRDLIYSWPLVNGCRVDQETVEGNYADTETFKSEQVNVLGLDTLERLLFNTSADNECSTKSSINKDGSWDALSAEERSQNRADYAVTLATILVDHATELTAAWNDEFSAHLIAPGGDNPYFDSMQAALNAVSDSMFYFDKVTKDTKLGIPLGLSNCEEEVCPLAVESTHAQQSALFLRENLMGMKMMLLGGPVTPEDGQMGWVDLLASLGASDLANDMLDGIDAAIAALDTLGNVTIADGLTSHFDDVSQVYNRIQEVTTTLKGPFLSTLNLQIPASAATDND